MEVEEEDNSRKQMHPPMMPLYLSRLVLDIYCKLRLVTITRTSAALGRRALFKCDLEKPIEQGCEAYTGFPWGRGRRGGAQDSSAAQDSANLPFYSD